MAEKQPGTAIINWADEMAKHAVAVAKQETPTSGYISLKASVMSYGGAPVPNNKLDVIILDYAFENTYYEGKYDPNNTRSPECFAIMHAIPGADPDDMVPHDMSATKQADNCGECANLKWGSDPGGGRGKACQERRRLIMIPANAAESADKVLSAETAIMKLPVTSVKLWANYVATVATLNKRPPWGLVTQIGTQPNPKSQFNVTFTAQSALPDAVMQAIMQKRELCLQTLLKPYDPNGEEEAAPAPKKTGKY
jgi:hypothetical protein